MDDGDARVTGSESRRDIQDSGEPGQTPERRGISRKNLLKAAAAAVPVGAIVARGTAVAATGQPSKEAGRSSNRRLDPTPMCDDGDEPTISQTEGPYFKPNSPQRTDITSGKWGTALTVSGYVFGLDCQPLGDVLLDFWQADDNGHYDGVGYDLRGHQYTKEDGSFELVTIVPGLYPGRTRHIHVKAQAPNHPILTTQLYFPGEPRNNTDRIFDRRLLMNVRSDGSGEEATFDFVLKVQGDGDGDGDGGGGDDDGGGGKQGTWETGVSYQVGDTVTYNGQKYRCVIAHTSLPGWEPPNVPALWQPV